MSRAPSPQRLLALVAAAAAQGGELPIDKVCGLLGVGRAELPDVIAMIGTVGVPPFGPEDLLEPTLEGEWLFLDVPEVFRGEVRLPPGDGALLLGALDTLGRSGGPELAARCAQIGDALREALAAGHSEARHRAGALAWVTEQPFDPALFDALALAAATGRRLRLRYHNASRDRLETREVVATRLVQHGGRWYLRGASEAGPRWYRLDRLLAAEDAGAAAEVPADPAGEPRRDVLFDPPSRAVTLDVRFDVGRLRAAHSAWRDARKVEGEPRVLTLSGPTVPVLLRRLFAFGGGWEVVRPAEAREEARRWAEAAAHPPLVPPLPARSP